MFLQTQHVLWLYTQNNNLAVAFQIRILRPENSRKITIESSFLREEIENSYHRRRISTIQPAFLLLWPINVSHCRVHTGTLRTGHPVYSRATYIRNGGARDRVRSRRNVCARPCTCIYMRRGLVAARLPACLPATALGCAARQDIEPSATQPGDHPRVQATPLLGTANSRQSSPRYFICRFRQERGASAPRPPPLPRWRSRQYPPATQVDSSDRAARLFGPELLLRTHRARTFSQVNNTRDTTHPTDVRGALFARVANAIERPENLERARLVADQERESLL